MFILSRKIAAFLIVTVMCTTPVMASEVTEIDVSEVTEMDVSGMPTDAAALQQQAMEEMYYRPFTLTEDELSLLYKLVFAESGNQSDECQMAVTNVILNRLEKNFGGATTLSEVIYAPGQFTPALNGTLGKKKATQRVIDNVNAVLEQEITIDKDVMYFNSVGFFSWAKDYKKIDDMYFSKK